MICGDSTPPGESGRIRLLRTENLLSLMPGLDVFDAVISSPLSFFLSVIRTFFFLNPGVPPASFDGSFWPRLTPCLRLLKLVDMRLLYLFSGFCT